MTFENEVYDYIRQYDLPVESIQHSSFYSVLGFGIFVPAKRIIFHGMPVPFPGQNQVAPGYFQEKSLEYIAQGIQLVQLWQDQWIKKPDIVRSRIAMLLGSGTHIHARQTIVRRINKDEARTFLEINHLQGYVTARHAYGLFMTERLVAVATFSSGRLIERYDVKSRSFELLRYASLLHHRVVGGIGKLLMHFVRTHRPSDIMTYADLDWASGKGYELLHFQRVAVMTPQMFWIHPAEQIRYYPHRLPEKITKVFQEQNEYPVIDDFLTHQGYLKIYNAGNLKFILLL